MAANPQEINEAADAELLADLAAHLRGASASQFLDAALHGLSPGEIRMADEAAVQPKAAPVWEGDAKLTFCDTSIDLGIAVFGRRVPAMPARADTPAEPAFIEIDSVMAFGEGYDIDIYDALSWADLQNISDAIMEAK